MAVYKSQYITEAIEEWIALIKKKSIQKKEGRNKRDVQGFLVWIVNEIVRSGYYTELTRQKQEIV